MSSILLDSSSLEDSLKEFDLFIKNKKIIISKEQNEKIILFINHLYLQGFNIKRISDTYSMVSIYFDDNFVDFIANNQEYLLCYSISSLNIFEKPSNDLFEIFKQLKTCILQ